ncbi:MAG: hypothetical protein RBQ72_12685 [Desulfobacterium sp.]|jgi:PBP1b-binding outer membrane lipoprotein LpoB|nr:hypothetical protein [Desulfobacterium sp.]
MFVVFAFLLVGCAKGGPAESAGKKIDNTIEETGNKISDMGDSIKNSTN